MLQPELQKNIRFNFVVNVLDGAFFGLGLGFVLFDTIMPLFISTLTDSTLLIGLSTQLHAIGWQLPQLFTAGYVTRLARYKPTVIFMTIQERWPFFGLALVAGSAATLGKEAALVLAFVMLMWHALGAGFTGTAWQSMIGKIFPANLRGTFWGVQAAGISVLMAVGSVVAGLLIDRLPSPLDFTLCFLAAGAAVAVSMAFLALTREPAHTPAKIEGGERFAWRTLVGIMRTDSNFRRFVMARMLTQLTMMAVAFYTIYAVRTFGIGAAVVGVMGASRPVVQMVANPILGWIGDRWGHRRIFALGSLVGGLSALVAFAAPDANWFYLAFGFAGFANATFWTGVMAMTLEFGSASERPLYIGLANTLIFPATLGATLLGGWLADSVGFGATFLVSAASGLLTAAILQFLVADPGTLSRQPLTPSAAQSDALDLAA